MLKFEGSNCQVQEWDVRNSKSLQELMSGDRAELIASPSLSQMKFENLEDAEKKVIEWTLTSAQTKLGIYPFFIKKPWQFIGFVGLRPVSFEKQLRFEFIFCFPKKYIDQAEEAGNLFLDHARTKLGLTEIVSFSSQESVGAGRVFLTNLGMTFLRNANMVDQEVEVFRVETQ